MVTTKTLPGRLVRTINGDLSGKAEDFRDVINLHAAGKISTPEALKRYDLAWRGSDSKMRVEAGISPKSK